MVDRLYGVVHSLEYSFLGLQTDEAKTHPSGRLIAELLGRPPGTKVGIEYTPKFNRPFLVDGLKITIPPSQRFYWQTLRDICREKGHETIYLEDFHIYEEFTKKVLQGNILISKLEQDPPEKEKWKLQKNLYKLAVEADYIWTIKRELAFLKLIQKTQPEIVIMGRGHTEYLTQNLDELTKRDIRIENYQTETVNSPEPLFYEYNPRRIIFATMDENPTPNPTALIERKCLERRFKAVTEGRVTDGTPNFTGTWDTSIPAKGLFEIYTGRDGLFTGKIEDCFGTALFRGEINDQQIFFTKVYLPSDSSGEAFQGKILYRGNKTGDIYKGRFEFVYSESKKADGGEFILQKA